MSVHLRNVVVLALLCIIGDGPRHTSRAQDAPDSLPGIAYHLTARPFHPLDTPPAAYLDVLEDLCRYLASLQDERGAVVDPYLGREHQYSTPYFAYAIGVLLGAQRAADLRDSGVRAMEHATHCLAEGWRAIPDHHGEFFVAPLCESLELYRSQVSPAVWQTWKTRLQTPLDRILQDQHGRINNWRTYAMKGEWLRCRSGLVARDEAIAFIDDAWLRRTQRVRIAADKWNLYQDWSSDPQSHAVEAVGRGNLLALAAAGYDGPHADEIARIAQRGTEASLLWQSPDGQCPPNGRTDNHVFNDLLYQLAFEVLAEQSQTHGDLRRSGQFRRAGLLAFGSLSRWRREEANLRGSFFVTKNRFDPADRVGYQPASQYSNYNATIAYHLAEAYRVRSSAVAELPAPTEVGGYVVAADPSFASMVANAGGMQVIANLRGDTVKKYDAYWTPLGVVRFGRVGWDGRLGPADGAHDAQSGRAVTFAPTWREGGRWVCLAERAEHYRGTLTTEFVHPLLVRFQILYHTVTGQGGPSFRHEFIVTPDGVLCSLYCSEQRAFGLTLPVLTDDGRPLDVKRTEKSVSISYPNHADATGDEQNFLMIDGQLSPTPAEAVRSAVGWLAPLRAEAVQSVVRVLVYPRNADNPTGNQVLASFRELADGFATCLGSVRGNIYCGRTSGGGHGESIDLDDDGKPDVNLDRACGFVVQHTAGRPLAIESDQSVHAELAGEQVELEAYRPWLVHQRAQP